MKIKSGFTIAELMIAMAIIGVLAAISLPVINSVRPNKEMVMLKKAYFNTVRIVSELINDEDLYPDVEDPENPDLVGFAVTSIRDLIDGESEATLNGIQFSGDSKFCGLFVSKLNINHGGDPNDLCQARVSVAAGGNFTSTDGMIWSMPVGDFSDDEYIVVDVNGDQRNNCAQTQPDGVALAPACNDNTAPDTFVFRVDKYGKVELLGDVEKEYITSSKTNKNYDEFVNCVDNGNCGQ